MAVVLGGTEVQVKKTGSPCTVPNVPRARLMYYFDCICSCVEADEDNTIRRLRNYSKYLSLSDEEETQLLMLCVALSPNKLTGSIFFPAEEVDLEGYNNHFFELLQSRLLSEDSKREFAKS